MNVCRTSAWHLLGHLLLVPNNCYGKKRDPAVCIWGMTNPLTLILSVINDIQILLEKNDILMQWEGFNHTQHPSKKKQQRKLKQTKKEINKQRMSWKVMQLPCVLI